LLCLTTSWILAHSRISPTIDTRARAGHDHASTIPHHGRPPSARRRPFGEHVVVIPIAQRCARTPTSHLRVLELTAQEFRIFGATGDVLHEICRVLTNMWIDAFDLGSLSEARAEDAHPQWRTNVKGLMGWLDWSEWVRCSPECGPEVSASNVSVYRY